MEPSMLEYILLGLAFLISMAFSVLPIVLPIVIVLYFLKRRQAQRFDADFQAMSPEHQIALLSAMAAQSRWGRIDQVMSHAPGPMTESIMSYGAANGIDTSFLNKYV